MYAKSYFDPLVTRHPIYGGINSSSKYGGNIVQQRSIIEECNENILLKYVYRALYAHNMLSGKLVRHSEFTLESVPEPEKTFTVQIMGKDDLGQRENRVWFANHDDVQKLLSILVKEVGPERMHMIKEHLGSDEPNDIHKAGAKWLEKWLKDEDWPF